MHTRSSARLSYPEEARGRGCAMVLHSQGLWLAAELAMVPRSARCELMLELTLQLE